MADNARQFLMALDQLPEEVKLYFGSDLSGEYLKALNQKYGVQDDFFGNLENEAIITGLNFDPLSEIVARFGRETGENKKIVADFWGMLFLPISEYLPEKKIDKKIIALGFGVDDYKQHVANFKNYLEDYQLDLADELVKKFEEANDPKEEIREILGLFEDSLTVVLEDDDFDRIFSLNQGLNYLLEKEESFKLTLLNAVSENQGKIGEGFLKIDGKNFESTIANWLKDFISQSSSDYFDEIVLARYMTNNENAKKLKQEEKKLLSRLLLLYRNLKFFPEAFKSEEAENSGIIPVEKKEKLIVSASGYEQEDLKAKGNELTALEEEALEEAKSDGGTAELTELERKARK